jgi:hypothetical protein
MRLQNDYAQAIDRRDWDHFRTLFSSDVRADYPPNEYRGMETWLAHFIPFHDGCLWTFHMMMSHIAGQDADGIWASCYGFVQWTLKDRPGVVNTSQVLYRDRLLQQRREWVISSRRLDVLMAQRSPIADGQTFPTSVFDLVKNNGTRPETSS